MAGFFPGTGSSVTLGNTWQAISGTGVGNTANLYANCGVYYGLGASNVQLSSSFAGRYYPNTY
jgi:hypothetical protein